MSDHQGNEKKIDGSISEIHFSREQEMKLERLRQGKQPRHSKRLIRKAARMFTRLELRDLPNDRVSTTQSDSPNEPVEDGCPHVSEKDPYLFGGEVSCPNDEKQRCVKNNQIETKLKTLGNKATGHSESPDTALNKFSLVVRGKQFERLRVRKQTTTETTASPAHGKFATLRNDTFPVLSGPRFRPWSREKRERRKNDDDLRERQSPRNDLFNLQEILTEVSEIEKAHVSKQTNGDFISLTMPCKILGTMIQGTGLPGNEQSEEKMCEETDLICQSAKTDTQANEQLSEKPLRRKLMSYYEHGYAIEPFEAIVGEKHSEWSKVYTPITINKTGSFSIRCTTSSTAFVALDENPVSENISSAVEV